MKITYIIIFLFGFSAKLVATNQYDYEYNSNLVPSKDTVGGGIFFDFAQSKTESQKAKNKIKFKASIQECSLAAFIDKDVANDERLVSVHKLGLLTNHRLFLLDESTVGLLSSSNSLIRFYHINKDLTFTLLSAKYFYDKIPIDACADSRKNVLVLFMIYYAGFSIKF